ncbi:MAG: hypothetical protein IPN75_03480 [Dechloromonas sp.]|uniref:Uncharacterized protein n=1 Tax=Candidatus Dechloromonas phosphorivorans TaxID=2899244 RepID=A0A9D7LSA2_9RHOO|nr:hypothetical protein [Candidatus Dechloromonas phosphorivorans]
MLPRSKEAVIAAIKKAEADSLAEQDTYRKVIDAAYASPATEQQEELLKALDADRLNKLMDGECCPPSSQDWKIIKGYEWHQIPRRRQLEQVEDRDISFWLYMLGEVTDHTKRLKAMAKFYGYIGASNRDIGITFHCWQAISSLKMVLEASVEK